MEKIQLSKEEIICGRCGFVTHGYEDMIRHLSCTQEAHEENCRERFIEVEEDSVAYEKGKEAIKRLRERNG